MTKIPNDGQGNCLFISISDALKHSGGGNHNHLKVRATAINHLKKHSDQYFGFWDTKLPDGIQSDEETIQGFSKYIEQRHLIDRSVSSMRKDRFIHSTRKAVMGICFFIILPLPATTKL